MKEIERCLEGCLDDIQLDERPLSGVSLLLKSAARLFVAFGAFYDAFLVV